MAKKAGAAGNSDNIDAHTKTESIKVHYADLDTGDEFSKADRWIDLTDEPDHQELCNREQRYFLKAIRENIDLAEPTEDAVNSLKIAFACDESVKNGQMIKLNINNA